MVPTPAPQMTVAQQNQIATNALTSNTSSVIQRVVPFTQAQTFYPASQPTLGLIPQNVGLLKRFIIKVSGQIANSGTVPVTLTDFGIANIFSNVSYVDLSGYTRINTTSQHLTLVANAKRRRPFGGTHSVNTANGNSLSQVLNVVPAEWPVFQAPQTIAAGASGTFEAFFEVPIAYSDYDFRGAIYTNLTQGQQQLNLTPNINPITTGTDDTFSVYTGAAGSAGNISSMTVTVYQVYLDQLPVVGGNVLLPAASMSQAYLLLNTPYVGLSQSQDFAMNYAAQREFLSTFAIYNSTGGAGGRLLGSDVNYWALQSANSMYIWKQDPLTCALMSREELDTDLPAGCYYFPSRKKTIKTSQFGNMQMVLNASAGSSSSKVQMLYEAMATLNTLVTGQSVTA